MRFKRGFTLIELMVSVSILALISGSTIYSLRGARDRDELKTATRILSGDLRNIQARALASRNVLTCEIQPGIKRVCENENKSSSACIGPCEQAPPPRYGIYFLRDSSSYSLFADVHTEDWRLTNEEEVLLIRNLNPMGGDKVSITNLRTELGALDSASIGAGRQNGVTRVEACGELGLPACSGKEPRILLIVLAHSGSGETAVIEINSQTGRVSSSSD